MTVLKFISIPLLTFFCLTFCKGQDSKKSIPGNQETSATSKLQTSRQLFWDNLPKPTGWINDFEGIFSNREEKKLDSIISAFEIEKTAQICILTLDTFSTTKDKFNDLALHIANTWGVGHKNKNNGVTICISKGYRKIRICNGYGIEKVLSDSETKEIIEKYFIANFKKGLYFKGTLNGLLAIIEKLRKKLN